MSNDKTRQNQEENNASSASKYRNESSGTGSTSSGETESQGGDMGKNFSEGKNKSRTSDDQKAATISFIAEPGKQEIITTCIFDASRELVFRAYTDPELIPKWWGPAYFTTTIDKMEVRKGGIWRFVQHDARHNEFVFHGVYHEVLNPERLIYTFEWEGMPGHVIMETIKLEEQDGKTKVVNVSVFQNMEDRDGMLQSGMEAGVVESNDRLASILKELQKGKT